LKWKKFIKKLHAHLYFNRNITLIGKPVALFGEFKTYSFSGSKWLTIIGPLSKIDKMEIEMDFKQAIDILDKIWNLILEKDEMHKFD